MDETTGSAEAEAARVVEERVLLAQVARGGLAANSAMKVLLERYQPRFKAYLRSRGFREADIADVVQRVWLDVARKAIKFSATGVASHWLWGFLRNERNDALRANARHAEHFVTANDDDQESSGVQSVADCCEPSPETQRQARDYKDCVQRAFAEFKRQFPNHAQWMYLVHVEGWDLEQIASYRDSTLHAASQFVSVGRKRFAKFAAHCLELKPD